MSHLGKSFDSRRNAFAVLAALSAFVLFASSAHAEQIGDIGETSLSAQIVRFFTLADPAVRYVVAGCAILGACCGMLGSFLVVRKMALVGDTLSHAVLPGVALGFLWNTSKDPVAIFMGATLAGLLGTALVEAITRTTRLKEDAALGLVLASFFAVGICLMTMIQQMPEAQKSGLDKFLFGQAAAISPNDLLLMSAVTAAAAALIFVFYKELLVVSFDCAFAQLSGLPVRALNYVLTLFTAFAVVIALQAVGVVLVSAMLITPAAAAYLLTDRLHKMVLLAAAFGLLAGVGGAFLSFLGNSLPTGPLMVVSASTVFVGAFLFGPRHGVLARWRRRRSQATRIERENLLKTLYRILEDQSFKHEGVSLVEIAERRRETLESTARSVRELEIHSLATTAQGMAYFTPAGRRRAEEIVRNHRLWELYLTNTASIASDHVHEDAEKIEHVLGEDVVRELERRLNYATKDPHGRDIPALSHERPQTPSAPHGYGGKN